MLLLGTSFGGKLNSFGFLRKKYEFPQMAKKCFQVLSFQKGQKHLKNALSAPFWPHRKQCWENSLLKGQMDSKFRNSTCSGKYIDRNFQQAHLEKILFKRRPPESATKRRGAQGQRRRAQDGKLTCLPKKLCFSPSFFSV